MASTTGNDDVRSIQQGVVQIHASVTFTTSGDIASTTGGDVTITESGSGLLTCTFDHKWPTFLNVHATYFEPTAAGDDIGIDTVYDSSTGVIILQNRAGGAGTAANAVTGNVLYLTFYMQNTTVGAS